MFSLLHTLGLANDDCAFLTIDRHGTNDFTIAVRNSAGDVSSFCLTQSEIQQLIQFVWGAKAEGLSFRTNGPSE